MRIFFSRDKMAQLRYPYTLGAMVRRFPAKEYIRRNWVFKVLIKRTSAGTLFLLMFFCT
jgi:hypothetical protein